jgi:hypothetical protein
MSVLTVASPAAAFFFRSRQRRTLAAVLANASTVLDSAWFPTISPSASRMTIHGNDFPPRSESSSSSFLPSMRVVMWTNGTSLAESSLNAGSLRAPPSTWSQGLHGA